MSHLDTQQMLKQQAWEEAKGKLRASVAMSGCGTRYDAAADAERTERWQRFDRLAEAFISSIEDFGLCE